MTLGEKLLAARLEAGLSQRQLCADVITRNMLSQIEHGTARPSMATLQYLAGRLGKSVSYFLEDAPVLSPNQQLMTQARRAWQEGNYAETRLVLEGFQSPDPVFQWERGFLIAMSALAAAEQALREGKHIYARELLKEALDAGQDFPGIQRQCLLLQGQLPGEELTELCRALPALDEELLLRAEAALCEKNWQRALNLLNAMEKACPRQHLLRGRALLEQGQYAEAAASLHLAEDSHPEAVYPALEQCYRELEDYKNAYRYAAAQMRKL